jgi:hypothetical protein
MNKLLTITAIFEGVTGVTLILVPSVFVSVLLGVSLAEPSALLVARLAGTALLTLAMICWLHRNPSHSVGGIIKALLFYNIAASALLVYASTAGFTGPGIWPATLTHTVLGAWCFYALRPQR